MVGTSGIVSSRREIVTASALHLAGAHQRQHLPDIAEHDRDVARHDVLQRRPAAAIGDVIHLDAGQVLSSSALT